MKVTDVQYKEALLKAKEIQVDYVKSGCGRVYVEIIKPKIRKNSAIEKVINSFGYRMTARPYHSGNSRIYVGYDNANGKALREGKQIAKALTEIGVSCYSDGDDD